MNPETGNELRQLRSAPGYTPFTYGRGSGEGLGDFPGSAGTASNTAKTGIWFYEAPNDYVKSDNLVETTEDEFVAPAIVSPGKISGQVWLETDRNLENQLLSGATKNAKDPVASGSTVWASVLSDAGIQRNNEIWSLPAEQRASATKEMLQDKNNLAKTGYAVVNEDGKYTIDLGEDYDPDNLYMWVTDANGDVISTYSSFTQPVFTNPRKNLAWAPTSDPLVYRNYAYNVNFAAIALREASLDITNFDMTDKPAAPGATAQLELSGRLGEVDNVIEWRNSNGDVLKSCDVASVSDPGDCATFEVPADAKDGEVFHAVLISNGNEAAADSFIVSLKTSVDGSGVKTVEPTADEQDSGIKVSNPDDDTKVSAKDEDGKDVPAKIDDNGNVVVTPGEDVDGPITVTVEDPDLDGGKAVVEVPVNGHKKGQDDNNSDKTEEPGTNPTTPEGPKDTDGDGIPDSEDTDDDNDGVNDKDEEAAGLDPKNPDSDGDGTKDGEEDNDGDGKTNAEESDADSDKITDKDGNGVADLTEKDTDGDGIPDSEDTDIDGDGVNNEDEKAAGLNPEKKDSDGNGVEDGQEDSDDDGIKNADESDENSKTITDKNDNGVADLTEKPDDAAEKPSIDAGSTTDKVVADGESHELDDTVKNPTEGMTGEVIGENGKAIDGAEVTVDPETGEISVTVPEGTKAQNATVVVKDKDGNKVGDIDIEITKPKDNSGTGAAAGDDEGDESLSSKIGERCLATGLGAGIPLLFLIPVGLASQLNIPGLKEFVAPIDAQIQALNTQLQKQAGIFQGPLAGQAAAFDAQLKRFGLNAGSIALIAAGALAIGLIADACTPGAGSSDDSSDGSSDGSSK